MKINLRLIVLLLLIACCPLAFGKAASPHWELSDAGYSYTDKYDVSSPSGAALIQQIGKKASMQGCLVYLGKGFDGIVMKDAPDVRISIDPVEFPKDSQIRLKYVLKKYSRKPNDFKGHFEA
ncbi:MAG: hypothetical protein P4L53_20715 [Candidatus Obscuribacterales bacterium]|nr:hypothetical protein [Candidatus Obscuribacterales bacterium]